MGLNTPPGRHVISWLSHCFKSQFRSIFVCVCICTNVHVCMYVCICFETKELLVLYSHKKLICEQEIPPAITAWGVAMSGAGGINESAFVLQDFQLSCHLESFCRPLLPIPLHHVPCCLVSAQADTLQSGSLSGLSPLPLPWLPREAPLSCCWPHALVLRRGIWVFLLHL